MQAAGDFGFADAGAMQFPDFRSVYSHGCGPTQPFAVLPSVGQASPGSFPQNLSFELGEDCQQAGHRTTGGRCQVQRLGQRYETRPQDAPVPGVSPADPLPTGPSDPAAIPAPGRSPGDGRLPVLSRGLRAAPPRSSPRGLAWRQSSPAGPHTPAWHGSASAGSAGHWWIPGRTGQPATFSPTSVPGQKRYRILPFEKPVWRPFRDVT